MEWIELEKILKQIRGITYEKKDATNEAKEGYTPIIRANNIQDFKFDYSELLYINSNKIKNEQIIKKDDIIIATSSGSKKIVGKAVQASENMNFSFGAFCKLIRITSTKVNSKYVGYYFNSDFYRNTISNLAEGANINNIRNEHINNLVIPVPAMEIQEKIVEVLDGAQALIDKRKEQIQLLDSLIESTFYTMFGDPVKNEKGWDVEKLKTTTEIITGNTPPRKDPQNYGDYIEWIKSDNINTPYTIVTKAKEYLSEIGKKRARYVPKNSILMTCIAGSLSCIGNVAITDREVAYNQQINGFIPKKYSLYFLYNLFCLSKEFIQNKSTSSMKGMISKGVLSELEFIVPPLTLQNEFADKVEVIEKQKKLLEKSLELLEENYKSIMDKAFKGQLWKV